MGSGVRGPFRLLLSRSGAKDNSVKRTVADGVTPGLFGYASKDPRGQIRLEKMRESLFDAEVDISDDTYILKAEDSQKLLEPPRLAKLNIRPENVVVKVGEQAQFSCAAVDQYGQQFPLPASAWSASGGTITAAGLFTAGQSGGAFNVPHSCGRPRVAGGDSHQDQGRACSSAGAAGRANPPLARRCSHARVDEHLHESPNPLRIVAESQAGSQR